jgi:hypothetical protein
MHCSNRELPTDRLCPIALHNSHLCKAQSIMEQVERLNFSYIWWVKSENQAFDRYSLVHGGCLSKSMVYCGQKLVIWYVFIILVNERIDCMFAPKTALHQYLNFSSIFEIQLHLYVPIFAVLLNIISLYFIYYLERNHSLNTIIIPSIKV